MTDPDLPSGYPIQQGAAFCPALYKGFGLGNTQLNSIVWESAFNSLTSGGGGLTQWTKVTEQGIALNLLTGAFDFSAHGIYAWHSYFILQGDATHYAHRLLRAGSTLDSIGNVAPAAAANGNIILSAILDLRAGALSVLWQACRANFGASVAFGASVNIDGEPFRVAEVEIHRIG